jgi:hypothetical protein
MQAIRILAQEEVSKEASYGQCGYALHFRKAGLLAARVYYKIHDIF